MHREAILERGWGCYNRRFNSDAPPPNRADRFRLEDRLYGSWRRCGVGALSEIGTRQVVWQGQCRTQPQWASIMAGK